VTSNPDDGSTWLVHPLPTPSDAMQDLFQHPYSETAAAADPAGDCSNTCSTAADGICDDGGPGAETTTCTFGDDCTDCGARNAGPGGYYAGSEVTNGKYPTLGTEAILSNPSGNYGYLPNRATRENPQGIPALCGETCSSSSDGDCDDGGFGAEYSNCAYGTDCTDCGSRNLGTSTGGGHPSDEEVGYYHKGVGHGTRVYTDTMLTLGNHSGVTMVKTPTRKQGTDYVALSASAHQFGTGTCNWIRHCGATTSLNEVVGSECTQKVDNSVYFTGYCFESSTGSLECGALIEKRDKWGQNQLLLDQPLLGRHSDTQYACPYKAPVQGKGWHEVTIMLVGGCMITSDEYYSQLADVHVPQMCREPQDYMKGCMFPRATNYDMSALQSDTCYFNTQGCTDSTALNYNIEANVDDGSCVATVKGCTMAAQYTGVALDTPEYDSSFVGKPTRFAGETTRTGGEVAYPIGSTLMTSVNNYESSANVLEGCVLTVEGCMDSTALNYDSWANINTNTWCVPVIPGCMMPDTNGGAFGSDPTTSAGVTRKHTRDGLAVNYNALATLNDDSCVVSRLGCTDSSMYNYDPKATLAGQCWPDEYGCLHPGALNYGCATKYTIEGNDPPYPLHLTTCLDSAGLVTQAAKHDSLICNFVYAPPSPPPVQASDGAEFTVQTEIFSAEPLEYFTADVLTDMCASATALITPAPDNCGATAKAGSTIVTIVMTVANQAAQNAGVTSLQQALSSTAAASSIFGVTVLTIPQISAIIINPDSDDNTAIIIGASVGGAGGLLLLVIGYLVMKRKKSKVEA